VRVRTKRHKHAAPTPMRKRLEKYGFVPGSSITDDLRSYGAAVRELGIESHHERGQWRITRVGTSQQPTRRRERRMQHCKSPGLARSFLSTHAAVDNIFNVQRHLTSAQMRRAFRAAAMSTWRETVAAT
jgi:transposase-like protein